ncbi:MAG: YicC family protein [Chlamydiia bacterium]|nr:YicC family protein [Chlamydiia bacterium]
MIKSMTACGRGVAEDKGAHLVVEIQTVNRKHLDIQIHLPRTLSFFEADLRHDIAKAVARGQVSVRVSALFHQEAPYKVMPNLALAEEIKAAWDEVGKRLGTEGFKEEFLSHTPDFLSVEFSKDKEPWVRKLLLEALQKALSDVHHMKAEEGKAIKRDFSDRLELISETVKKIETLSKGQDKRWKERIEVRLKEVQGGLDLDERIARELALMADKYDITEEGVRFQSHVAQFKSFIDKPGAYGKTLEFILQELGREINTMGSKCQDADISMLVIIVKSELEKMREQVQNVE